jgi:cytochrome c oxidase accessory protein FixG
VRIKGVKYLVFAICAWFLASTFLAYFIGRQELITMMQGLPWENPVPFGLTVAMMGVMLFQFGWFREQFCTVVCPYARFQSVMLDSNSLTVGYDKKRGEPRGKPGLVHQDGRTSADCVDCKLCIKVCPTGIDIRNGLQLECIACAACIDACDSVMDKLGRARGLIRYDTELGLAGEKAHILRPRVIIYALILVTYAVVFGWRLSVRSMLEAQVLRDDRGSLFTILADGRISNHLTVRVSNKAKELSNVTITVVGNDAIEAVSPISPFPVPGNSIQTIPLFLNFSSDILRSGKAQVELLVAGGTDFSDREKVTIMGPPK